jgi:hypothetical protein
VDLLCADAEKVLGGLDSAGSWDAVVDAEPSLAIVLTEDECDAALLAIANFVGLKSPYTLGHSHAVADLAATAGSRLGLSAGEVRLLYRAGLVHDFGRLGVSSAIWDKKAARRGRVGGAGCTRTTASACWRTGRLRRRASRCGAVNSRRLRYPWPVGQRDLALGAPSVLGAYQAMGNRSPTVQRGLRTRCGELRQEVRRAARRDVVGPCSPPVTVSWRREGPAGLTAREVEVLRLAQVHSNKDIAADS